MRRAVLLLSLVLFASTALHAVAPARRTAAGGSAYKATPEVSWFTIFANGKRAGFGRSEYGRGEGAPFSFQNLTVMSLPNSYVAERVWWEFSPDLRPANLFSKTIYWRGGQSVTNTVDGVFDYGTRKLALDYHEWGAQEKLEVPIPARQVARYTSNLVLAHARLAAGQVFKFTSYSLKDRRFVQQQITVREFDSALRAWKLEGTSEEAPGAVSTLFFQPASAGHPNGWMLKSIFPGPNKIRIELEASTRDQAVEGFEKEASALGI